MPMILDIHKCVCQYGVSSDGFGKRNRHFVAIQNYIQGQLLAGVVREPRARATGFALHTGSRSGWTFKAQLEHTRTCFRILSSSVIECSYSFPSVMALSHEGDGPILSPSVH